MNISVMKKQKILVIDDDPIICRIVQKILEQNGYEVLLATNGNEGLGIAKSTSPDLILLDIMLPDIDGFEICRKLRGTEKTSDISIIMMTAADQSSDIVRGLDIGADDYATKPFSPLELVARIKSHLRRKKYSLHRQQD